jgi:hypothetical protein
MKPGIYATKKATAPITIAMVRMIRSSLSSGNMTQDGVFRLNMPWPFVPPQRVSVWHHYHWISNRCRAKHQA